MCKDEDVSANCAALPPLRALHISTGDLILNQQAEAMGAAAKGRGRREMKKENDGANGAAAGRCGNRGLSGHSLDDLLLARFGVKCLRSCYTGGGLCSNIPD
jgi:hypothetical protein